MSEQSNGFFHSPFWQSWWGKITAFFALWLALPTDEVFEENIGPAWTNAKRRLRNGWGHASEAVRAASCWLAGKGRQLFGLTALIAAIWFTVLGVGLSIHNPILVGLAGIICTVTLLALWLILKAVRRLLVGPAAMITETGLTTTHGVLAKVGLAKRDGDALRVDISGLDVLVHKTFMLVPACAAGHFFLAHVPHWVALGILLLVGLGAMAIGLISAYIGDSTVEGWRLVKRVTFVLMIVDGLLLVLWFYLPKTYYTYVRAGKLDAWLADPSWSVGWVGTLAAIVIVAATLWVLAGRFGGEAGRRFSKLIFPAAAISALLVFVFMGPLASKVEGAMHSVEKVTDRSGPGSPEPSSLPEYPRSGNTGGADLDAPDDVEHIPVRPRPRTKVSDTKVPQEPEPASADPGDPLAEVRQNVKDVDDLLADGSW